MNGAGDKAARGDGKKRLACSHGGSPESPCSACSGATAVNRNGNRRHGAQDLSDRHVAAGVGQRQRVVQYVAVAVQALDTGIEHHVGLQEAADLRVVDAAIHVDQPEHVEHVVAGKTLSGAGGNAAQRALPVGGVATVAVGIKAHSLDDAAAGVGDGVDRAQGVGEQVVQGGWFAIEPAFDGDPANVAADLRAAAGADLDEFDVADPARGGGLSADGLHFLDALAFRVVAQLQLGAGAEAADSGRAQFAQTAVLVDAIRAGAAAGGKTHATGAVVQMRATCRCWT